jgi:hypothetical protein
MKISNLINCFVHVLKLPLYYNIKEGCLFVWFDFFLYHFEISQITMPPIVLLV